MAQITKDNLLRIAIFDVDNTLVCYGEEIPPKTLKELQDLKKEGYMLGLATGRSLKGAKNNTKVFKNIEWDFLIGAFGAQVLLSKGNNDFENGIKMTEQFLSNNKKEKILSLAKQNSHVVLVDTLEKGLIVVGEVTPEQEERLKKVNTDKLPRYETLPSDLNVFYCSPVCDTTKLSPSLKKAYEDIGLTITIPNEYYFETKDNTLSKSKACNKLLSDIERMTGAKLYVAGFGDSMNDDFLDKTANPKLNISFIADNNNKASADASKKYADVIIPGPGSDGLQYGLKIMDNLFSKSPNFESDINSEIILNHCKTTDGFLKVKNKFFEPSPSSGLF